MANRYNSQSTEEKVKEIKLKRILSKFCFKKKSGSYVVSFDDSVDTRDEFELFFDDESGEYIAIYRWAADDIKSLASLMYIYKPTADENLETFLCRIFKSMDIDINEAI